MQAFSAESGLLRKRSFAQLTWRGEERSCEHLLSMSRRVEDYPSGTDRICDAAEILQLARSRICKQDRKISIVAGSDNA
jgi:hypothetical protein